MLPFHCATRYNSPRSVPPLLFGEPKPREGIMSKATSYVLVALVAFLAGGFSFQLVGRTSEGTADSKPSERQAGGDQATAAMPREFTIEGMACQGCADSIATALMQVPGVKSAKVSFADKRAVVLAKESEVPAGRILAAITAAGYKGRLASCSQAHLLRLPPNSRSWSTSLGERTICTPCPWPWDSLNRPSRTAAAHRCFLTWKLPFSRPRTWATT